MTDSDGRRRSYPPPGHILRHLRLDQRLGPDGVLTATMPVSDDLRDERGSVHFGALLIMVDSAAGIFSHRRVAPDWVATSDLKAHWQRSSTADEVWSTTTMVRAGARNLVSRTEVADVDGPVAAAWVTYTRLPRRDDTPAVAEEQTGGEQRFVYVEPDDPPRPPFAAYLGLRARADELAIDLDLAPQVRNSFDSIQGGVAATLVERVGALAGERLLPGSSHVTDVHLHFLGQAKVGPIVAVGDVVRADELSVTTEVRVVDAGNDDRLLDLGTATATRLDRP